MTNLFWYFDEECGNDPVLLGSTEELWTEEEAYDYACLLGLNMAGYPFLSELAE